MCTARFRWYPASCHEQHCDTAKFKGWGLGQAPAVGGYCDAVFVCAGRASEKDLSAVLDLSMDCTLTSLCATGRTCSYVGDGFLSNADWDRLCTASLLPVESVSCQVFGP
jgi:hypothetical protein